MRQEPRNFWQTPQLEPEDEAVYAARYAEEVRARVRLFLPIAVALNLAFIGWDVSVDRQIAWRILPVRIGWALIAVLAWSLTATRVFVWVHQWVLFLVVVSAGASLTAVVEQLPLGLAYGAEALLLVVVFAALFRLRVVLAAIAFAAIGVMTGFEMVRSSVPSEVALLHELHFASMSCVALAYAHLSEVWSRQSFILQRQLARERDRSASLLEAVRSAREERISWLESMARFLRHELKNQLIGIQSSLGMLRGRTTTDWTRFVERAERSANVMSRIVEAATEATSLEGALEDIDAEEVDLAAISESYARDVAAARPDRIIRFSDAGAVTVRGDVARIVQMLEKIVQNAIDHAPEGGSVEIRTGARDGLAWIQVENDGAAIAGDGAELFQPFASFRSGATRRGDNLGLGLYVARQIARAHGGELSVARPIKSGAAFEIRLPLAAAAQIRDEPR